ncbi:uncharacterized protein BDZ83DRAFT_389767 [Colletotrichum acutatum]|uniref:Uncharacterized protein n=1 Tax=Glomerella acutata TaxID=27357 RepID=A0AAD8XG15_GLOAC|nr:uncharacterized protein BDZ83DRAFT_389767 [Colletotrichum acutatum]KAK1723433.1 hypothetical protein BDZ83DRAFT_389767 [Colletotrichum acutatum]
MPAYPHSRRGRPPHRCTARPMFPSPGHSQQAPAHPGVYGGSSVIKPSSRGLALPVLGTLQPIVPVCLGPFNYWTVDQCFPSSSGLWKMLIGRGPCIDAPLVAWPVLWRKFVTDSGDLACEGRFPG